ncbi:MAG: hypothetical protein GY866_11145 [Proteobacteria bacterium]|nr:hypothetical protein [Pseudomonadota bacterium]
MKNTLVIVAVSTLALLGLPMMGIVLARYPISRYLEFPPETRYVDKLSFSRIVFVVYALVILAAIIPLVLRGIGSIRRFAARPAPVRSFPWWGWVGVVSNASTWFLAWTRLPWFEGFQPYTFTPLWLSYILAVNALTYRRTGRCMMIHRPGFFLRLFPISAAFWWFFEYLNRFVQNWFYVEVRHGPWDYFWLATVSFSTVLPAVLGTRDWLSSFSWMESGFKDFFRIEPPHPRAMATVVLAISGTGLACIGILPNLLFPLLWMSPLLIFISLQSLAGQRHVLSNTVQGDWSFAVASALAALLCGGFWEMWNFYSLTKWEYAVPLVHKFQVFEMPILGYAGYLPFGLECSVLGGLGTVFSRRKPSG